mmetsp:Transcript_25947/g.75012  ORF Transcript_25947/g.75012 Transcript_25947/m.75012 type:complete len:119 (+) Transcript_25947:320-676(+)
MPVSKHAHALLMHHSFSGLQTFMPDVECPEIVQIIITRSIQPISSCHALERLIIEYTRELMTTSNPKVERKVFEVQQMLEELKAVLFVRVKTWFLFLPRKVPIKSFLPGLHSRLSGAA